MRNFWHIEVDFLTFLCYLCYFVIDVFVFLFSIPPPKAFYEKPEDISLEPVHYRSPLHKLPDTYSMDTKSLPKGTLTHKSLPLTLKLLLHSIPPLVKNGS